MNIDCSSCYDPLPFPSFPQSFSEFFLFILLPTSVIDRVSNHNWYQIIYLKQHSSTNTHTYSVHTYTHTHTPPLKLAAHRWIALLYILPISDPRDLAALRSHEDPLHNIPHKTTQGATRWPGASRRLNPLLPSSGKPLIFLLPPLSFTHAQHPMRPRIHTANSGRQC